MASPTAVVRRARWMVRLCSLAMVLLPLLLGLAWFFADPRLLPGVAAARPDGAFAWQDRLGGFALGLLPQAVLIWGLARLRGAFVEAAAGHYFSARAVRGLRLFALAAVVYVPVGVLANAATSVALTWGNEPGQRALAFSVGSGDLFALFLAALFLALAQIWDEGRRLADDLEQIV